MAEIYNNDSLKIIETKKKSIFTIELLYPNEILINTIINTKMIHGAIVSADYRTVRFKAQSIESLIEFQGQFDDKYLPVYLAARMLEDLTKQLNYLIQIYGNGVIGYSQENIIVINKERFIFLGSEQITEINNELLQISSPFLYDDFYLSPELLKVRALPSYIHFKTGYFSLACLIIRTLLSTDDFYTEYLQDKEPKQIKIMNSLNKHPIKGTKLYWLLSRCLDEDPKRRSILLI